MLRSHTHTHTHKVASVASKKYGWEEREIVHGYKIGYFIIA